MRKYIDAEKLIAEIERRLKIVEPRKDTFESCAACRQELIWMKEHITSLQQEHPEVELEKDIDAFFDKWDKNSNGAIFDENGTRVTIETIKGVVKHFLNAKK